MQLRGRAALSSTTACDRTMEPVEDASPSLGSGMFEARDTTDALLRRDADERSRNCFDAIEEEWFAVEPALENRLLEYLQTRADA
jgi:hypothetical protein